jgi:hypothetical protein
VGSGGLVAIHFLLGIKVLLLVVGGSVRFIDKIYSFAYLLLWEKGMLVEINELINGINSWKI